MFGIRPVWWVVINSTVSFAYLFIVAKILGKKQIAQLEFVDYVVGITLGSIAGDFATDANTPFYFYLISMGIFFVLALCLAIVGRKTPFLKRLIKGRPVTLVYDGKINYKQLCRANIDVNDLLSMLRDKNYFNINDVAYAVFEPSGKLSVLPKPECAPAVAGPKPDAPRAALTNVLVADGEISYSGLNECKKSEDWLLGHLGCPLDEVILAVYDDAAQSVVVHKKTEL